MPEFLAKLGGFLWKGTKGVAAGQAQANLGIQSPHLATAMVRVGRFLYASTLGWIGVTWYTGYINERTKPGSGFTFVLPGSSQPVISTPDRPDKGIKDIFKTALGNTGGSLIPKGPVTGIPFSPISDVQMKGRTLVALSPMQLGVPGSAVAGYLWSAPDGQKQKPPYHAATYQSLVHVASSIAKQYGLTITSGYRPQSTGSLHSSGLAFDMVGRMSDMKRAASWAAQNPGLFQEIFVHNEGSGMHLHLGFYPDAAQIFASSARRIGSRANTQAGTQPTAPPINRGMTLT